MYGEDIEVLILHNHGSSAEYGARHEVTNFDFESGDFICNKKLHAHTKAAMSAAKSS